jgi:hypothetical protein
VDGMKRALDGLLGNIAHSLINIGKSAIGWVSVCVPCLSALLQLITYLGLFHFTNFSLTS